VNVLKPHLQTTIATLLATGTSHHEIERVTGIDRKTIRTYQQRLTAERANSPGVATDPVEQIPPPWPPAQVKVTVSACEPHRAFIEAQVRAALQATAIHQDLVDQFGFDSAYNSVERFALALRARAGTIRPPGVRPPRRSPGRHVEGAPTRVPGTARSRKPRLFVMTLWYSRRRFRRVVWKSSQETWARLHEDAWRYFGGQLPLRYVVLDNLKEGVTKPRPVRTGIESGLRRQPRIDGRF
jgi:transposase